MLIGRGSWVGILFRYLDLGVRWLSVAAGACLKTDPDKLPAFVAPVFGPFVRLVQQGWMIPAILIGAPVILWLRSYFDRRRAAWVHELLDTLRDHTFTGQQFEHEQNRRVTLFRYRWFNWRRWPFFGGWLIPYERSGHQTRKTDAIFYAPDDGEKAEGVAGRAWSRKRKVYVPGLPGLREPSVSDEDFEKYSREAFCSEKRLRNKPPQARSLCGVPVEVGNKQWGVIVVDSVLDGFRHQKFEDRFRLMAPTLSRLLAGG
jgi:hypothetical protein